MLWARFAALLCASLLVSGSRGHAQNLISFKFTNGTLNLEAPLLVDLAYETTEAGLFRLTARSPSGKTSLHFFNREGKQPLDYEVLLADLGIDVTQLETLADANGAAASWSLRRVINEGQYFDMIIDYKLRSSPKGSAAFVLVGEDDDFYSVSRAFASMANHFQPVPKRSRKTNDPISIPDVEDSFWEVVLAILLLIANICFIWYGFRALARTRSLE